MRLRFQPVRVACSGAAAAFLCLSLSLTGCGGGEASNTCELSGKVSYKGTPLTGGRIKFQSPDLKFPEEGGYINEADIGSDGTYSTPSLTPGPKIVTITSVLTGVAPKGAPLKGGGDRQVMKIPPKYADPKTSNLTFDVQAGSNTKDWDLSD